MEFYICKHCGNIVTKVKDSGVPLVCCGEEMVQLKAGTTDGAKEKHVPVYEVNGNSVTVSVGSVEHPMLTEHYIEFICLVTKNGVQVKHLNPGEKPVATFALVDGDEVVEVYEYCNLHSLWKA